MIHKRTVTQWLAWLDAAADTINENRLKVPIDQYQAMCQAATRVELIRDALMQAAVVDVEVERKEKV